jgi:four helix bundle protein
MKTVKSYRDLLVWRKAISISVAVYKYTKDFPREEMYSLTSQIRRASNSVSLNIAEGFGRGTTKGYVSFLYNARGSLLELESAFLLAKELDYVNQETCAGIQGLVDEESRMLNALITSLQKKTRKNDSGDDTLITHP